MSIESRLLTLERHSSGNRVVRIFQQVEDSPSYYYELNGGDAARLYTQADLDRLGDDVQIIKIVYE